jgi:hypothetical protein
MAGANQRGTVPQVGASVGRDTFSPFPPCEGSMRIRRGVAHAMIVLDAIERSPDKLVLTVRYSGDRTHRAQTRKASVAVPHARVHSVR